MRRFLVLLAAILLAGCYTFASDAPLYDLSEGNCPFTRPTIYANTRIGLDGAIVTEPSTRVEPFGRRCLSRDAASGAGTDKSLFVPLQENWYVVQREINQGRAVYGLVRIANDRFYTYNPECNDFTDDALQQAGVVRKQLEQDDSNKFCFISDKRKLESLFRAWIKLGRAPAGEGVLIDAAP